jgi:hypothetical protein
VAGKVRNMLRENISMFMGEGQFTELCEVVRTGINRLRINYNLTLANSVYITSPLES